MKSLLKTLIISLSLLITSSVIADSNSRSHDVTEYVEVPVSKFRLSHEHPNEHPNEHPSVPPPPLILLISKVSGNGIPPFIPPPVLEEKSGNHGAEEKKKLPKGKPVTVPTGAGGVVCDYYCGKRGPTRQLVEEWDKCCTARIHDGRRE